MGLPNLIFVVTVSNLLPLPPFCENCGRPLSVFKVVANASAGYIYVSYQIADKIGSRTLSVIVFSAVSLRISRNGHFSANMSHFLCTEAPPLKVYHRPMLIFVAGVSLGAIQII